MELENRRYNNSPNQINLMNSSLQDIQIINEKIACSARQADWNEVMTLTSFRHQLVQNYCEQQEGKPNEKMLMELQDMISQCDDKLQADIKLQKDSNIQNNLNLRKSFRAANRYQITQKATNHS